MDAPLHCPVRSRRLRLFALLLLLGLLAGTGLLPSGGGTAPVPAPVEAEASSPAGPQQAWTVERLVAPRQFQSLGSRSLALDAFGYPHVAYGGDLLYHAWYDGSAWQIETVDDAGGVGEYTSLAVDAAGGLHISYLDAAHRDLKYAHGDGAGWQIETVDGAGDVGYRTALALDAAGRPHITYQDWTNAALKYAHYDGAAWQIETVMYGVGDWQAVSSLAVDAAGRPHLSVYTGGLTYAHHDGSGWLTETVIPEGGRWNSLVLDAAGRPHISFAGWGGYSLQYAYHDGSAWSVETIDDGEVDTGFGTSLRLDGAGLPVISYESSARVRLAHYDGSTWQSEVVAEPSGLLLDISTSLALDGAGRPHVIYMDWPADRELKYALHDGTAWQATTVDASQWLYGDPSLALDAAGRPRLAYAGTDDALSYMAWGDTGWQGTVLDRRYSIAPALALDAAGYPHIAYHNYGAFTLGYASFDGTAWHTATVAFAGKGPSLALDAAGRPHIAFYGGDYDLMYAYHDGSSWHIEVVDGGNVAGESTSLALDAAGNPHIAYHNATGWTGNDLRYAFYDGAAWQIETVADWGARPSLALDAAGRPHLSFYAGHLEYAYHDGAAWQTETVDAAASVGYESSLALDSLGHPRIAYNTVSMNDGDLRYTAFDGAAWQTETVDAASYVAGQPSLALDSLDRPYIAYGDYGNGDLMLAYLCYGIAGVSIMGPGLLPSGITGHYTATVDPPIAQLPRLSWDNGTAGRVAAYTWPEPGDYTVTVTATNGCSQAAFSQPVTVYCQPVEGAAVQGPARLPLGVVGLYTATHTPLTASPPLTRTWDNGAVGAAAAYSWTVTGTQALSVTVENDCGEAGAGLTVTVFCQEITALALSGPLTLVPGLVGTYQAAVQPMTASLPLTLAWDNGTMDPAAHYSWTLTGTYTVSVVAANPCGQVAAALVVRVVPEWPWLGYLPLMPVPYFTPLGPRR